MIHQHSQVQNNGSRPTSVLIVTLIPNLLNSDYPLPLLTYNLIYNQASHGSFPQYIIPLISSLSCHFLPLPLAAGNGSDRPDLNLIFPLTLILHSNSTYEEVQLRIVFTTLRLPQPPRQTSTNPFQTEALQLQGLRQGLHQGRYPQDPHEHPRQRGILLLW